VTAELLHHDHPALDAPTVSVGRAPRGQRSLPPFPIEPYFHEPAADQATRLLTHLARLVEHGHLAPADVFDAVATSPAPRSPADPMPDVEPYARWMALRRLGVVCHQHATAAGWAASQPKPAQPGDWLYGVIQRVHASEVAATLRAATQTTATEIQAIN
jgi:hypothetical protein